MMIESAEHLAAIRYGPDGLVPVISQHFATGEVLLLAYGNEESLRRSLEDGELWFYSRSRNRLWKKGESSGNTQRLVSLALDCDSDAVLARVDPRGPACHTGARSCFKESPTLVSLGDTIAQRFIELSENSYTVRLLNDHNLRLRKLGEEAVELALACNNEDRDRAAEEAADLLYHTLVACKAAGVTLEDVLKKLEGRRR